MIKKSQEIEEYVQGFLTKSRKDIKQIREELGIKLKDS